MPQTHVYTAIFLFFASLTSLWGQDIRLPNDIEEAYDICYFDSESESEKLACLKVFVRQFAGYSFDKLSEVEADILALDGAQNSLWKQASQRPLELTAIWNYLKSFPDGVKAGAAKALFQEAEQKESQSLLASNDIGAVLDYLILAKNDALPRTQLAQVQSHFERLDDQLWKTSSAPGQRSRASLTNYIKSVKGQGKNVKEAERILNLEFPPMTEAEQWAEIAQLPIGQLPDGLRAFMRQADISDSFAEKAKSKLEAIETDLYDKVRLGAVDPLDYLAMFPDSKNSKAVETIRDSLSLRVEKPSDLVGADGILDFTTAALVVDSLKRSKTTNSKGVKEIDIVVKELETQLIDQALAINSPGVLEDLEKVFPENNRIKEEREKIEPLEITEEDKQWQQFQNSQSLADLESYANAFPKGKYMPLVESNRQRLEEPTYKISTLGGNSELFTFEIDLLSFKAPYIVGPIDKNNVSVRIEGSRLYATVNKSAKPFPEILIKDRIWTNKALTVKLAPIEVKVVEDEEAYVLQLMRGQLPAEIVLRGLRTYRFEMPDSTITLSKYNGDYNDGAYQLVLNDANKVTYEYGDKLVFEESLLLSYVGFALILIAALVLLYFLSKGLGSRKDATTDFENEDDEFEAF